jgi:hypothetical protein
MIMGKVMVQTRTALCFLLFIPSATTWAQAVAVCVNSGSGAMRMLLNTTRVIFTPASSGHSAASFSKAISTASSYIQQHAQPSRYRSFSRRSRSVGEKRLYRYGIARNNAGTHCHINDGLRIAA